MSVRSRHSQCWAVLQMFSLLFSAGCGFHERSLAQKNRSDGTREVSGVVLDWLEQPVQGAAVDYVDEGENPPWRVASFLTDPSGRFAGRVTSAVRRPVVRITKANYVKYEVELGSSRSSVSCRLRRTTSQAEICGLVAESKQDVCQRVCEVLLSDPRDEMTMGDSDFAYFAVVENLRVGLRSAVTNRFAGCAAARILCLGGDPEDVRYVFDRCNDTHTLGSDALVRAWIAGGLVSPPNPQAWQYLEQCLHKRYGPLATVTAAQALVVNGSSDAVRILGESCARQEVRKVLGSLVTELELLLPTLTSERFGSGFALAEDCLRELAYVMLVDDPRRRFAVETLKLYKDHDRAFARVRCSNDRHLSIHSVTLRWKDGRWFVVGIWPYAQSY